MFEELSLHILDIAMNSLSAGASSVGIVVAENLRRDRLMIRIRDNGRGMDEATLRTVLGRSVSTKAGRRKPIGLGLALLRQTTEMCDGAFQVESEPGRGTQVSATMRHSHVDRPPLGDLAATIRTLCVAGGDVDVQLHYRANGERFHFRSRELKTADQPEMRQQTREAAVA